jgi:hypothetical protein
MDFARSIDEVIVAFECDLHDVIIGIVGDPDDGQPLGGNLVAEVEGRDFDLRALSREGSRDPVEEGPPGLL